MSKDKILLKIDSQAYGGYGVGRHEGRVFFVLDTLEGDLVHVRIEEEKKNFVFASVIEHVQYNPLRKKSDCPFEKHCGGCQWISIDYSKQLEFKQRFLQDSLKRIAGLKEFPEIQVHQDKPRYYRNRAMFRGTIHEDGRIHVGFMERATHKQVPIDHCLNVHPQINSFIKFLYTLKTKSRGQKFRLEVQVLPLSEKPLILVLHSLHGVGSLKDLHRELGSHPQVQHISFAQELSKNPIFLFEEKGPLKFHTSPGAFQQVNLPLNQKARCLIEAFVSTHKISSILDLFCGSGNLSLPLASPERSLKGVEQSPLAIKIAKKNIEVNKIKNADYSCAPAHQFLKNLVNQKSRFDLIITDPPRKGMKECLDSIMRLKADFLIYMSCDPTTLARDLKVLGSEYRIVNIHLLDFFPNTYHLESLVFMERKSSQKEKTQII